MDWISGLRDRPTQPLHLVVRAGVFVPVLSYVTGVLFPVAGPALVMAAFRPKSRSTRQHMWASLMFSGMWFGINLTILWLDGRLFGSGKGASGIGSLLSTAGVGLMIVTAVVNIQRVKLGRPPLLFRHLTEE